MNFYEIWMILSVIVTVLGAAGCIAVVLAVVLAEVLNRLRLRLRRRRPMASYVDDRWRSR